MAATWAHIFKCNFVNENVLILIKKFTEVCSQWSNWQNASIGSDNGMAPNRLQTIIWTNADPYSPIQHEGEMS